MLMCVTGPMEPTVLPKQIHNTVRRDPKALNHFVKTVQPCPLTPGTAPTFGGALTFLRRHKSQLEKALTLVRTFPYLMEDKTLDGLWDFIRPFLHTKDGKTIDSNRCESKENSVVDPDDTVKLRVPCVTPRNHLVFLCCPDLATSPHNEAIRVDAIIRGLLPFAYVHLAASTEIPRWRNEDEQERALEEASVFIFLLSSECLTDPQCLGLLTKAVAQHIPVVMLRDPSFHLPAIFPDCIQKVEFHKRSFVQDHSVPSPNCDRQSLHTPISPFRPSSSGLRHPFGPLSKSPSMNSLDSFPHRHTNGLSSRNVSSACGEKVHLSTVISDGYSDAIVYMADFHDACMTRLYTKLADILGKNLFPDAESLRLHRLQMTGAREWVPVSVAGRLYRLKSDLNSETNGREEAELNGEHSATIPPVSKNTQDAKTVSETPAQRRTSSAPNSSRSPSPRSQDASPRSKSKNHRKSSIVLPPIPRRVSISRRDSVIHVPAIIQRQTSLDLPLVEQSPRNSNYKETTYLLVKRPGAKPEVVSWPPREDRRGSLYFWTEDSDSESSYNVEFNPGDIDILRSTSTSPDL